MFKKRYLPIFIVLLLVISSIAYFGIEKYRIVAVCRDTLTPSGSPFRENFKDKHIFFLPGGDYPPITVLFDYRGNTAFCHVRRNGLGWQVDKAGVYPTSPLPQIDNHKFFTGFGEGLPFFAPDFRPHRLNIREQAQVPQFDLEFDLAHQKNSPDYI